MANDIARVAAWLQPKEILLDIEVPDREQALHVAATAIARSNALDPAPIYRALLRREQAHSTALGDGFAVPHARIAGIATSTTVYMRTSHGLAFHAPDGKPVTDLLAIMVPPDGANDDHLKLLALVARLFSDRGFRKQLHQSPDVDTAARTFRQSISELKASPR